MKLNKTILLTLLASLFLSFSSISIADEGYVAEEPITQAAVTEKSYGRKIGDKTLRGLSNMAVGFIEIPKSMILISNNSNFMWGITAGPLLGALNTVGRFGVGTLDLITFPLATKPAVHPVHPWENYLEVETDYYYIFDLDF